MTTDQQKIDQWSADEIEETASLLDRIAAVLERRNRDEHTALAESARLLRSLATEQGAVVTDPASLVVGDVVHIKWRGFDHDYTVRRIEGETIVATHHDDSIGYVYLPFDGWGEHLGDPVVITLVKKARVGQ